MTRLVTGLGADGAHVSAAALPALAAAARATCLQLGREGRSSALLAQAARELSEVSEALQAYSRALPTSASGRSAEVAGPLGDAPLTTSELADRIGVGERHVRDLARAAGVVPVEPGRRPLRWPRSAVATIGPRHRRAA